MSMRKASVLEMATAAYELDAAVKRGVLHRVEGRLTIMGEDLENVLQRFEGQEIVLDCGVAQRRAPGRSARVPHVRARIFRPGMPALPRCAHAAARTR